MKNLCKILSLVFSVFMLVGCYADKGNYDYTLETMNEITSVTFSPAVVVSAGGNLIEVKQALGENDRLRRVEAVVEQTVEKDLSNLDFYWCRVYIDEQGKEVKDTICSRGYLEFELPVGKPMSYEVMLCIIDRTTDLSHYSSFTLSTRPPFKNSLFVLHGPAGDRKIGNIEIIDDKANIYTDVKTVTKDNNHYENATGFGYTTYMNIPENLAKIGETKVLTVYAANGETRAYDPYGMKVRFTASQIFKPESEEFLYRRTVQTGDPTTLNMYKVVLTDNGEVYIGNYVHALYKPGAGYDGEDTGLHQADYEITAATITHNRFLLWDAKNGRFLYSAKADPGFAGDEDNSIWSNYKSMNPLLDANVKFQGVKSPADMTAVMGFINYRDNYDLKNPFFLFKDEAAGEYYLYELEAQDIGDGSKAKRVGGAGEDERPSAYAVVDVKKLAGLTPTDMSTITYNSWFTTDNLFFAQGNTVYRYNVSNGDKFVVYEAPEGNNVTKIKFRTEESSPFSADLGLYLNIVMFNGTNGAIGEVKLNVAADVDEDYAPLLYDKDNEGNAWGEIKDIQFVNEYVYKVIEY